MEIRITPLSDGRACATVEGVQGVADFYAPTEGEARQMAETYLNAAALARAARLALKLLGPVIATDESIEVCDALRAALAGVPATEAADGLPDTIKRLCAVFRINPDTARWVLENGPVNLD